MGDGRGVQSITRDTIPLQFSFLISLFISRIMDNVWCMFPQTVCRGCGCVIRRIRLFRDGLKVRHLNPLRWYLYCPDFYTAWFLTFDSCCSSLLLFITVSFTCFPSLSASIPFCIHLPVPLPPHPLFLPASLYLCIEHECVCLMTEVQGRLGWKLKQKLSSSRSVSLCHTHSAPNRITVI